MKLLGEGGTPKPFVMSGELKSSISLLRMIPVEFDLTLEPKLQGDNNHKDNGRWRWIRETYYVAAIYSDIHHCPVSSTY